MPEKIIPSRLLSVLHSALQKRPPGSGSFWRKRALILGGLVVTLLILGHLGVRFVLWPQIEKSKSTLESMMSSRLGASVTMDDVQVSWTGIRPKFVIQGLKLTKFTKFTKPDSTSTSAAAAPLIIERIQGELSWLSFYYLTPYFHQISANGVQLYIQRDAKGFISVAGIPAHSSSGDLSTENWLLAQNTIEINNAQLVWEDQQSQKLKTTIDIERFRFNNGIRKHQAELTALTPWSQNPIQVQADFVHRLGSQAGNWHNWTGQFSWDTSALNLSQLLKDIALPLNDLQGRLTSKGSIELDAGKVNESKLFLAVDQLKLQLNKDEAPIEFGRIETNLVQEIDRGLNSITTKTLSWRATNDLTTKPLETLSPITFRWRTPEAGGEIKTFGFSSPKIQLEDISLFALNLPLSKKIRQWVKVAAANGELKNLEMNWSENKSALANLPVPGNWFSNVKLDFSISAKLNNISFTRVNPSLPSITNLTGNLTSNQKQGNLTINSSKLELNLDNFLSASLFKFNSAKGELSWTEQKGAWLINAKKLQLSNPEITASLDLNYLAAGPKQPDQITLDMQFFQAKLATVHRYLPIGIDKEVREYLGKAFDSGDVQNGSLHIKGNVDQIPFPNGQNGEFTLHLPIVQASYKPAPLMPIKQGIWSAFNNINGKIDMKQSVLSVDIDRANYKNTAVSNVLAQIPDVTAKNLTLLIKGQVIGDGSQIMEYVVVSPIGVQQPSLVKGLSVSGPINLDLGLKLPLSGNENASIDAKLTLSGNKVQWGSIPPLENLKGKVRITEKNPEFENVTANFLGGNINVSSVSSVSGAPSTTDSSSFNISGTTDARFIKNYVATISGSPPYLQLLNAMSGTAKYEGSLNFNKLGSQTNLVFDLRNWASLAPSPANKLAGSPMLGQFKLRTFPATKSNLVRADWSAKLGEDYFLQGNLDSSGAYKNAIGIGAPLNLPQQGLAVNIVSKELNLDTWMDFIGSSQPKNSMPEVKSAEKSSDSTQVTAQIKRLIALDRAWDDFSLNAVEKNDAWQLRLSAPLFAGQMQWTPSSIDQSSGLITGRLSKLKVPEQIRVVETASLDSTQAVKKTGSQSSQTKQALSPSNIPSLDITIDDLTLKEAQLGQVKIRTKTTQDTVKIESLQINNPQANSTITGQWIGKNSNTVEMSSLTANMDIKDFGLMISRWSNPKSVEGGSGKLKANVSWSGSIFSPDEASLAGKVSVDLNQGRLLEVNTDGAKLLDVLSLQSLFRFATLDLQGSLGNLATKGTPFKSITSHFEIGQGIAQTERFTMILDQARVAMTGQINIPQKTQDLRITIFPTIDATAGSLAAFALNPIIGLGAVLGQYLITSQINRTMQTDYLVQGSWRDPEVVPLDQKGRPLDAKTLNTIRTKNLLKEQDKPDLPSAPQQNPTGTPTSNSLPG